MQMIKKKNGLVIYLLILSPKGPLNTAQTHFLLYGMFQRAYITGNVFVSRSRIDATTSFLTNYSSNEKPIPHISGTKRRIWKIADTPTVDTVLTLILDKDPDH